MGASAVWTLVLGVVVVATLGVSSPIPRPNPAYDPRLSALELAIIKCIVETVPGVTKGGGGSFEWSVAQSKSKELQGVEVEVIQVPNRDPNFSGRSDQDAGDGYPDDWNIVRLVSSQLENRENGEVDSQRGLPDNWVIQKSISIELHLDTQETPGNLGGEPALQPPEEQTGIEHVKAIETVMLSGKIEPKEDKSKESSFKSLVNVRLQQEDSPSKKIIDIAEDHYASSQPESSDEGEGFGHMSSGRIETEEDESEGDSYVSPVDVRLQQSDSPSETIMEGEGFGHMSSGTIEPEEDESEGDSYVSPIDVRLQQEDSPSEKIMEGEGFGHGISEQQESYVKSGIIPQEKGTNKFEGEGTGFSIVRSISSEQEPIEEMSSSGSHQTLSASGPQAALGGTDSYDLVQPLSTELQPADSEAEGIPASLTEIFPPPENMGGGDGSWNNPLSNAGEPSEVYLPEITQSPSMETQQPCEKGHRRIKNVCRKVHTFQLKSHLR